MNRFDILLKPTGMSRRKNGAPRAAEIILSVAADDANHAARQARAQADAEGFTGYAITKIKEVK